MYVAGALKYSVNSAAVGGGESISKLYGLNTHDDLGLKVDDSGVPRSVLYLTVGIHNISINISHVASKQVIHTRE
jgi:hypothetical protein